MTELEQLETETHFSSLKRMLDRAGSLYRMDRLLSKRGGLTKTQARLFAKYFQKKDEVRRKLATKVREAPLTVAK
jgi:hypothetical protein